MNDSTASPKTMQIEVETVEKMLHMLESIEELRDSRGRILATPQWYNGALAILSIIVILFGGLLFVFEIKSVAEAASREAEQVRLEVRDAESRVNSRMDRQEDQLGSAVTRIEDRLNELSTFLRRSVDERARNDGADRSIEEGSEGASGKYDEQRELYGHNRRPVPLDVGHPSATVRRPDGSRWLWSPPVAATQRDQDASLVDPSLVRGFQESAPARAGRKGSR